MTAKLIPASAWSASRYDPPIAPATLRRWCATGKVPGAVRTGRNWRIPADAEYCAHPAQPVKLLDLIYGGKR